MFYQREEKIRVARIDPCGLLIARLIIFAISIALITVTVQAVDAYAIDAYTQDEYWEDQLHSYGAAVTWTIGSNASYSGISSTVVGLVGTSPQTGTHTQRDLTGPFDLPLWRPSVEGHLGTTATILAGVNGEAETTISMGWRNRTDIEVDSRGYPMDGIQMPPMAYDTYGLISDVLDLNGVVDKYVLEMDYSDDARVITNTGWAYTEEGMAAFGWLYLGWFEDTPGGGTIPTVREWVNAIDGNLGIGSDAVVNYLGSYDDFLSDPLYSDTGNLDKYLGSWGVDTTGDTVWAILDHNGEFGVVPEPATMGMLVIGGLAILKCKKEKQ